MSLSKEDLEYAKSKLLKALQDQDTAPGLLDNFRHSLDASKQALILKLVTPDRWRGYIVLKKFRIEKKDVPTELMVLFEECKEHHCAGFEREKFLNALLKYYKSYSSFVRHLKEVAE